MSTSQIDHLQLKALEERAQLHRSASELRKRLSATKEKLRFSQQVRKHFAIACAVASLVGLLSGYGFAGLLAQQ
jgi:hypothetical protein